MKLNKALLKKLINEVIREAEEMSAENPQANSTEDPKGDDSVMKHTRDVEKKQGETLMTFTLRGLKPGKRYKEIMAKMAYNAKQADLDVIHAEIEKNGKPVDTMDIGELNAMRPEDPDDQFDTTAAKSVTRKTSKEKPPIQGDPADWERLGNQDIAASQEKVRLKKAKIAAGTYDPNDTSLWTDKEWDAWEVQQRQKDPKSWAAFDAFLKAKQKA
jgi:hypothetical protein